VLRECEEREHERALVQDEHGAGLVPPVDPPGSSAGEVNIVNAPDLDVVVNCVPAEKIAIIGLLTL
jgi:hypothetical protein